MKAIIPGIKQLRIMTRPHHEVGQPLCTLCGQRSFAAKTRTGLYDGSAHLGDICNGCLRSGRQGASRRTRAHALELRRLADFGRTHAQNDLGARTQPWLTRYADYLDELARCLECMAEWMPKPGE